MDRQIRIWSAGFAWCESKSNLTVSGINGIENRDSELVQVTINIEEYGSQKLKMAIHSNLVIGDRDYDVQRMKRQYPQLANDPAKSIRLKDVKVILGTDLFFHNEAIRI